MSTNSTNGEDSKRNFSKFDSSGTDPNRYASISNDREAEEYLTEGTACKSLIPGINSNVSTAERVITAALGTYLLYSGLTGKKSVTKTIAGGTLLARAVSGYCPGYDAVEKSGKLKSSNVNIRTEIQIDRPVEQVYNFWRKLENLPKFLKHIESVNEIDEITSEWKATGPAGIGSVSWKAQILMDEKNKLLSWHSLPGSTIDNAGKVYFRETGNGTELDVTISYHAPLGIAGEAAGKALNPWFEKMVKKDIENLKTYLETGSNWTE